MRQIVLDTETTGLDVADGHRIIEIGCVELVNRKRTGNIYHQYICPDRDIDAAAVEVHGITTKFLASKPVFQSIAEEFLAFVADAELVIHNADFDMSFLDYELSLLSSPLGSMADHCRVLDTLSLARRIHPGQRNSLDALCKRYGVPATGRELHGALLDARLLSDVYLAMTGGQAALLLNADEESGTGPASNRRIAREGLELAVLQCSPAELSAHEARLSRIDECSKDGSVWRRIEQAAS